MAAPMQSSLAYTSKWIQPSEMPCFGMELPEPTEYEEVEGEVRPVVPSLTTILQMMGQFGMDYSVVPLCSPGFEPFVASNRLLKVSEWCLLVVGKVTSRAVVDACAIQPEGVPEGEGWSAWQKRRSNGVAMFDAEVEYCSHSTLPCAMVVFPNPSEQPIDLVQLAGLLVSTLEAHSGTRVWLRLPLLFPPGTKIHGITEEEGGEEAEDPLRAIAGRTDAEWDLSWKVWNKIKVLCESHARLCVALEVDEELPILGSDADKAQAIAFSRWSCEEVKCVFVNANSFTNDMKGNPRLGELCKDFLAQSIHFGASISITGFPFPKANQTSPKPKEGRGRAAKSARKKGRGRGMQVNLDEEELENSVHEAAEQHLAYSECIKEVYGAMRPQERMDKFLFAYNDHLQAPLQPLQDHLDSATYEVFEADPIKYARYEEAIKASLVDKKTNGTVPGPDEPPLVLMVVGAGRGPLVRCAIRAAECTDVRLKIYAVEKNRNALVTLQNQKRHYPNWECVTIVGMDMRYWDSPEGCDILVSELLGSFSDNELSPECLDGAQRFLKPDGISIPYKYTSYAAPHMSSKIHNAIVAFDEKKKLETGFVVRIHAGRNLDRPKDCFTFEHPNPQTFGRVHYGAPDSAEGDTGPVVSLAHRAATMPDNTRFTRMSFTSDSEALVHGFSGYFTAWLYKKVQISIRPEYASKGMNSWFPIFYPIRRPIQVHKGEKIDISIWRKFSHTSKKVWYEYSVSCPSDRSAPIHNVGGRSQSLGL